MIENWIDKLCDVWAGIEVGGKKVKSPYLIKSGRLKFPAAINPSSDFPIALTIPNYVDPYYSAGRKLLTWYGVTEFHITPDLSKAHLPDLVPWFGLILRAAASHVQLNDTVAMVILDRQNGIAGPLALKWGDEALHWGFIVSWMTNESPTSADLPVSA